MASAQLQQALALHNAGRHDKARPLLLACVQRDPQDVDLLAAFGLTLMHLGQEAQFEHHARRAVAALADRPARAARAWTLLGVALLRQRRGDEALAAHERGCELAPGDPDRLRELGNCANLVGDYVGALAAAERGLALAPDDPDFLFRRAANTQLLGRAAEAEALLAEAVARHPGDPAMAEALAQASNYVPGLDPSLVRRRHDHFGDMIEGMLARAGLVKTPRRRSRGAGERLRVGLLSPDFRRHSVAWFVEPLLRHHDAGSVELFCYSTAAFEDAHSARLRGLLPEAPGGKRWRWLGPVSRTAPAAAAGAIEADGLDALVDLAGLTENNSALILAQRPAPVQITYLGYPAGVGLAGVGWRLVDALTDPPPPHGSDGWSRQRLLRLEGCFVCWQPPDDPGPGSGSGPGPGSGSGPGPGSGSGAGSGPLAGAERSVTFGSTNALMKLNDRLLSLWGRVLGAVPGSRLLIKARGLERASTAADLRGRLAAAGVEAARCRLEGGHAEHADHLRAYAGIDVLLDTWPYHGTTTTLEALWMGVPVVSLIGEPHASRVGLSLLTAAGVPELAARDEGEYVAKAVRLATDPAERARVSRGLRERVVGGPLCDGPGFWRRFEAGVRSACEQG